MVDCASCGKVWQPEWVACPWCGHRARALSVADSVVMGDVVHGVQPEALSESVAHTHTCRRCGSIGAVQASCQRCGKVAYCDVCKSEWAQEQAHSIVAWTRPRKRVAEGAPRPPHDTRSRLLEVTESKRLCDTCHTERLQEAGFTPCPVCGRLDSDYRGCALCGAEACAECERGDGAGQRLTVRRPQPEGRYVHEDLGLGPDDAVCPAHVQRVLTDSQADLRALVWTDETKATYAKPIIAFLESRVAAVRSRRPR